jgi:hypothetical protein
MTWKGFRRAVAPYFDQPAVRYRLQNHLSLVHLCEIFTSAGQRAPVSASVLRELCLLLPALPLPLSARLSVRRCCWPVYWKGG